MDDILLNFIVISICVAGVIHSSEKIGEIIETNKEINIRRKLLKEYKNKKGE